jgi:hypothetical protein
LYAELLSFIYCLWGLSQSVHASKAYLEKDFLGLRIRILLIIWQSCPEKSVDKLAKCDPYGVPSGALYLSRDGYLSSQLNQAWRKSCANLLIATSIALWVLVLKGIWFFPIFNISGDLNRPTNFKVPLNCWLSIRETPRFKFKAWPRLCWHNYLSQMTVLAKWIKLK